MTKSSKYLDIKLKDLKGDIVTLRSLLQELNLIYFYPKDNTPGCTKEACSFRDNYEELKKLSVNVIGISKDSVDSHIKFKQKHDLNFELLSDSQHELQEALGVWQKKKFMGREYMGTMRMSFLIDAEGQILKTYNKVDPKTHVREVINDVKAIKQS